MDGQRKIILDALRERVGSLPTGAGVYLFKDAAGVVLYVGKAKSLRPRVSSYLQPGADLAATRGPEIHKMIDKLVVDVDYLECESEVDAVLRESRLIKDIQPPYNAKLKDDKTFHYLEITTREDFPRVRITRQPQVKNSKLYGPFTSPSDLRAALPMMQRVFKFRTCKLDIIDGDQRRSGFRPCILHNIKQCTAPCAARVSKDAYAAQIKRFRGFLASGGAKVRRELTRQMQAASERTEFELAGQLRDELRALDGLAKRGLVDQHVQPEVFYVDPSEGLARLTAALKLETQVRTIEGIDIAHLAGKELCGSLVCFIDGKPFKGAYRRYKIKTVAGADDYASIREVVRRRYRHAGMNEGLFPDVILIDGGKGQLSAAWDAFDDLNCRPPMLISLAKRQEEIFVHDAGSVCVLRLSRHDPALRILQAVRDESHRFVQHYHHILRRRATLQQDTPVRSRKRGPSRTTKKSPTTRK